jgi:peptide chain release factor subunit 1
MFNEEHLRELLEYKADHPVLSIYLNTDPTVNSADAYKLHLRSMLKEIDLKEDVETVERYMDHQYDWSGRSVAMFSCAPEGFFRAYSFMIPMSDRVRIHDRPHVKPLANLLDEYGGYGVALVDKQGIRLFNFHLGELRDQEEMLGEAVRRTKRGGGSQAPGRRGGTAGQTNYVQEVAERNLREAAELAARFFSKNDCRRILIGGTEDNIAYFRAQLPKSWQSLVVGTFAINMNASQNEVLERALEVGRQAERRREIHLIKTVVTGAAKGRDGVVNLDDTLLAVHQGRVQTLLIREGYRSPGFQCQGCGFLTSVEIAKCPFCGSPTQQIPDVVETAVRTVMRNGGEVEVVHPEEPIKGFDGIGALLRY